MMNRIYGYCSGRVISIVSPWLSTAVVVALSIPCIWLIVFQRRIGWHGEAAPNFDGRSLLATVLVGACATFLAVIQGTVLASVVTLTRLPGRKLIAAVWLVPFIAPATVWALCQVYCYGPGGIVDRSLGDTWRIPAESLAKGHYFPTAIVLSQIHAPLVMVLTGRGMSRLGHAGFDAAKLYFTGKAHVVWVLRAIRPELVAAALLTFALVIGNFAVPHVLQCRLYPIQIYLRMSNYLDQTGAARASLPLVALAWIATTLFVFGERRQKYLEANLARLRLASRPRPQTWFIGGIVLLYTLLTIALPIGALVYECSSISRFLAAVQDAVPEMINTLRVAIAAAILACWLGLGCGALYYKPRFLPATLLAMSPAAFPALVLGLAYSGFFHAQRLFDIVWLSDSGTLLVMALAFRALPFATHISANGYARIAAQWREAAIVAGLSHWQQLRWVVAPLMAPSLAAAMAVAFSLSMADVEVSQLLCAPGSGTLALRQLTFLHFGPSYVTASLALLQIMLSVVPVLIYSLLTNRIVEAL